MSRHRWKGRGTKKKLRPIRHSTKQTRTIYQNDNLIWIHCIRLISHDLANDTHSRKKKCRRNQKKKEKQNGIIESSSINFIVDIKWLNDIIYPEFPFVAQTLPKSTLHNKWYLRYSNTWHIQWFNIYQPAIFGILWCSYLPALSSSHSIIRMRCMWECTEINMYQMMKPESTFYTHTVVFFLQRKSFFLLLAAHHFSINLITESTQRVENTWSIYNNDRICYG